MFGEKCRLGVVVPSSNTTVEPEWNSCLPSGVAVFASRVYQEETDDADDKVRTVLAMKDQVGRAARETASVKPSAVGFACTAASFLEGASEDDRTCRELAEAIGVPFVTASRAVVMALRSLQARRIGLVTPYIGAVDEKEKAFLAEEGFTTVERAGPRIVGNLPKGRLPGSASLDAVFSLGAAGCDTVFVSCTNWETFCNVPLWGQVAGGRVVSSNQALLWALLRLSGVSTSIAALGALAEVSDVDMKGANENGRR